MSTIVAVAGNLASGKSTLAAALEQHNGWVRMPTTGYDLSYIEDLFREPTRWAFEAQMSFLHHKAVAVRDAMGSDRTVVLDRSIAEDVCIFARYFHERGWMNQRSYDLYERYARWLVEPLAQPLVFVYCYTPPDECEARLRLRRRPYQDLYPADHIERLHRMYETWWAGLGMPVKLKIDTTVQDLREPHIGRQVAKVIADQVRALT